MPTAQKMTASISALMDLMLIFICLPPYFSRSSRRMNGIMIKLYRIASCTFWDFTNTFASANRKNAAMP